jgi:hypothetical protein
METEQILKDRFDKTINQLENRFSDHTRKSVLDATVFASIPMVQNYAWSILKLLNQEDKHILPAMALLRCLHEFTSRIVWILMGSTQKECEERLRRFEMSTLIAEKRLIKGVLDLYQNQQGLSEEVLNALGKHKTTKVKIEERIEELKASGIAEMPKPLEILKIVYGAFEKRQNNNGCPPAGEMAAILAWPRLHRAVHPDYLVLKSSISTTDGTQLYNGDVDADIDDLKYECCLCVCRSLQEIYRHYNLENLQKIYDVFSNLTNEAGY